MGCTMGKADQPATKDDGGKHSNQKVAKETNKTKSDDAPVITADNANTVKSEPPKANGDVTSDANKNTCQNNSEDTADKKEGGVDPAAHGAKQEDRFYNNKSFQKPDVDPSDPSQQGAALKIQTKYRQHHAKKVVQVKREEKAAVKIQAGFRGHQDRQKVKSIKESNSSEAVAEPEEGKEEEEIDIDLNDPEVGAAATKIQAGFRGHKARKEIKEQKEQKEAENVEEEKPEPEETKEEEEIDIDLNDPEVDKAASKIQAGFRGHQARKQVQAMKEQQEEPKEEQPEVEPQPEEPKPEVESEAPAEEPPKEEEAQEGEAPAEEAKQEEEIDIDLEDPEVQNAAVKIQAGFAGMKARKEVKAMKEANQGEDGGEAAPEEAPAETEDKPAEQAENKDAEEVDIDLEDPEVQAAATKIQASFKGYKTRKEFQSKKDGEGGEEDAQPE